MGQCCSCCRGGSEGGENDKATTENTPLLETKSVGHGATGADPKEQGKEKKEKKSSFFGRKLTSLGAQAAKQAMKDAPVDDKIAKVAEAGADAVQEQAEADPNASFGERLAMGAKGAAKMTGAAGVGGDTGKMVTDVVAAGADATKDQLAADPNASVGERLALAAKGTAKMAGATGIGGDVGKFVTDGVAAGADIAKDQITADPNASLGERVAIGFKSGANLAGASGVGGEVGELASKAVAAAAEETAQIIKEVREDMTADPNASSEERLVARLNGPAKVPGASGVGGEVGEPASEL